jgi:hypothetical protein
MKIYRLFINGGPYIKVDIKVVADNKAKACLILWNYIKESPNYDSNYISHFEIIRNTDMYEYKHEGILIDETKISELNGHFD